MHLSKGFTLVEIMVVVVIIGMLAAIAIPAFQLVRARSQGSTIRNNARILSNAADQYFLYTGESSITSNYLIGNDRFSKEFRKVASEVYQETILTDSVVTVGPLPNGDTIIYPIPD